MTSFHSAPPPPPNQIIEKNFLRYRFPFQILRVFFANFEYHFRFTELSLVVEIVIRIRWLCSAYVLIFDILLHDQITDYRSCTNAAVFRL